MTYGWISILLLARPKKHTHVHTSSKEFPTETEDFHQTSSSFIATLICSIHACEYEKNPIARDIIGLST